MQPVVLLLDDDLDFRNLIAASLVNNGYEVLLAGTGEEAFSLLAKVPVDLMIVDGMLPDLNGLEFLARVRHEGNRSVCILVSANPFFLDDQRTFEMLTQSLGVSIVLSKPIVPSNLLYEIDSLLSSASQNPLTSGSEKGTMHSSFEDEELGAIDDSFDEWVAYDNLGAKRPIPPISDILVRDSFSLVGTELSHASLFDSELTLEKLTKVSDSPEMPRNPLDEAGDSHFEMKVQELTKEYSKKLREQFHLLSGLVDEMSSSFEPKNLEPAYGIAHKIHGTAGTYGFQDVSVAIAPVENMLEALVNKTMSYSPAYWEQLNRALQRATDIFERAFSTGDQDDGSSTLRILLFDHDPEVLEKAKEIMRRRPIEILISQNREDILRHVQGCWLDGVIIGKTQDQSYRFEIAHFIRSLEGVSNLPIAFIGDRDDMASRLAAVRAGGDFFLELPFDENSFIEASLELAGRRSFQQERIMIVSDDNRVSSLILKLLGHERFRSIVVRDPESLLLELAEHRPDALLIETELPNINGFELCKLVRMTSDWRELPILLVGSQEESGFKAQALVSSADEIVPKLRLKEELLVRLRVRLERAKQTQERWDKDALTGMLSRHSFLERGVSFFRDVKKNDQPLVMCLLSLKNFSFLNSRYGYLAGDQVLLELGQLLRIRLPRNTLQCRWAGATFALLFCGDSISQVRDKLHPIFEDLEGYSFVGEDGVLFQVSISGIFVQSPEHGNSVSELFRSARQKCILVEKEESVSGVLEIETGLR